MKVLILVAALFLVGSWLEAPVTASERALLQTSPPPKAATAPQPQAKKPEAGKPAAPQAKPAAAPQKQEAAKGRTAPAGAQPAAATSQGARPGLGQFEGQSPDKPMLMPGGTYSGRRRALLQTSPPPKAATAPQPQAKKPEAGKPAAPQAKPAAAPQKQEAAKGRTAPAGAQPAAATSQGARPGLGQFEGQSPDKPMLMPGGAYSGRR